VGPRAGLDTVSERKIPSHLPDLEPSIIQPVAQSYTTELTRFFFLFRRYTLKYSQVPDNLCNSLSSHQHPHISYAITPKQPKQTKETNQEMDHVKLYKQSNKQIN
jgi:hypothetical protein